MIGIITTSTTVLHYVASDDHIEQMGAAESSESEDSGGIASQILRLKMAKSNGQMSEEEYEAGGPLPLRVCCFQLKIFNSAEDMKGTGHEAWDARARG